MNAQQIIEIIGEREPYHNILHQVSPETLSQYQHFLVYGDDGGDLFVKTFNTAEAVRELAEQHANGFTNCDFETHVYLIVCDGKQMKTKVVLVEVC